MTIKLDLRSIVYQPPLPINLHVKQNAQNFIIEIKVDYSKVYGMGERFDRVEQKGMYRDIKIIEKFCNQGALTYCPAPFFFTDNGFGIYADTLFPSQFNFEDYIKITVSKKSPILYLLLGTPEEIIFSYYEITGKPILPPKWSFGLWMSANRWNTQEIVEQQLALSKKHRLPASVVVLEAWSDEATFYLWNEGKWGDPKRMIEQLHAENIRLILWQIPVFKKLDDGQSSWQHDIDCETVRQQKLCVMKEGKPYVIPDGNWFAGSMIPDFTNAETTDFWFGKRKYLLDMGVDGFKTDGGEFIYDDSITFSNGKTGEDMKNGYAASYINAYAEFSGKTRVLFSRAGYSGQQNHPCHWAGDQQSTWEELRHVLTAGLSAGLSGIPFWGFDIGGFAGPLPSAELYERSTQLAVFAPIMQWHSEPAGGQFEKLMPSTGGINDRSPWNMAAAYGDSGLIERIRFHINLRYNLLPYLYNCAIQSTETGKPLLKHLIIEYPDDANVFDIDDCFMLGDMLIAPVIEAAQEVKKIYLPYGGWTNLWSGKRFEGKKTHEVTLSPNRIPVFVKDGGCLSLNLSSDKKLGTDISNRLDMYNNLCLCPFGDTGTYHFRDDLGNDLLFVWSGNHHSLIHNSGSQNAQILEDLV